MALHRSFHIVTPVVPWPFSDRTGTAVVHSYIDVPANCFIRNGGCHPFILTSFRHFMQGRENKNGIRRSRPLVLGPVIHQVFRLLFCFSLRLPLLANMKVVMFYGQEMNETTVGTGDAFPVFKAYFSDALTAAGYFHTYQLPFRTMVYPVIHQASSIHGQPLPDKIFSIIP